MIQLLDLILRLAADVDPQPLIELHVLFGNDDGEMRIAALQILQPVSYTHSEPTRPY